MSWTLDNECSLPANYFQPLCGCINPPSTVTTAANSMLTPYYCWYAPCLDPTVLKTPEIIQGQLSCNIVNCNITIDQINTTGGNISISNLCASGQLSGTGTSINLTSFVFGLNLPIFDFKLSMIFASILLMLFSAVN